MICAIHQPQYLPWLGYFDKMARADVFVLLDDVQFKKNEWQNRNRIRNATGWQWITVPVLHDHGQLIEDVRINPSVEWQKDHLRSIEQNYSKAPFFKEYWPKFCPVYEAPWADLARLNMVLVEIMADVLGIKTRRVVSSTLQLSSVKTQRLVDICRGLDCDHYLAGAGAAGYMDFDLMERQGVKVLVQDYKHPSYPQVFSKSEADFQPFLSTLDLIFNTGPQALKILRGA